MEKYLMRTCNKCKLPETYETIEYDENNVCNICNSSVHKNEMSIGLKEKNVR